MWVRRRGWRTYQPCEHHVEHSGEVYARAERVPNRWQPDPVHSIPAKRSPQRSFSRALGGSDGGGVPQSCVVASRRRTYCPLPKCSTNRWSMTPNILTCGHAHVDQRTEQIWVRMHVTDTGRPDTAAFAVVARSRLPVFRPNGRRPAAGSGRDSRRREQLVVGGGGGGGSSSP